MVLAGCSFSKMAAKAWRVVQITTDHPPPFAPRPSLPAHRPPLTHTHTRRSTHLDIQVLTAEGLKVCCTHVLLSSSSSWSDSLAAKMGAPRRRVATLQPCMLALIAHILLWTHPQPLTQGVLTVPIYGVISALKLFRPEVRMGWWQMGGDGRGGAGLGAAQEQGRSRSRRCVAAVALTQCHDPATQNAHASNMLCCVQAASKDLLLVLTEHYRFAVLEFSAGGAMGEADVDDRWRRGWVGAARGLS